jgi:enoyl-CoA hydratase
MTTHQASPSAGTATPPERDPDGRIIVEQRGPILLIGIDRPEKRNGMTPKMFGELARACTRLEDSEDLFVGLVHAMGDHFSGGVDLLKIAPLRQAGQPLYPPDEADPFNLRGRLRRKPMVVAFKGISFTWAVELGLASEICVAADDCRFAQQEVARGIMPSCGASFRLAQRAGWGHAMKILLTGQEFGAEEAMRLGLVQEVVPAGQEFDRALGYAQRIAAQAPLAVQAVMENARIAMGSGPAAAAGLLEQAQRRLYATEDVQEGIRSFAEKRPAVFRGR